jgi:hypothetical protein
MRDPERRDAVTVEIATSLALFALVVLLGGGLVLVVDVAAGLGDRGQGAAFALVVGCAAAVMFGRLYRRRR